MSKYFIRVRLADVDRTRKWREVEAESLCAAVKVAEAMEDVEVVTSALTATEHDSGRVTGEIVEFTGNMQAMGGLGPQGVVT